MFRFSTYSYDEVMQSELKGTLASILEMYGCREILIPIFTCINELLVNALKANYKNLYFEDYRNGVPDIPYETALRLFKVEISTGRIEKLAELARMNAVSADVQAHIENDTLFVAVENPYPMTRQEEDNVTRKLAIAADVDGIADFFTVSESDPYKEGAGLGIVFVGIMLKSMGLAPENLSIRSEQGRTRAAFSIPLNAHTVESYRKYKDRHDTVPAHP